jgi:hypothetical protein
MYNKTTVINFWKLNASFTYCVEALLDSIRNERVPNKIRIQDNAMQVMSCCTITSVTGRLVETMHNRITAKFTIMVPDTEAVTTDFEFILHHSLGESDNIMHA